MEKKYQITQEDLWLYGEGTNYRSYQMLGAHRIAVDGISGIRFAVWAPGVKSVRVMGDFTDWQEGEYYMEPLESSGVWVCFLPDIKEGARYKYVIETGDGEILHKADPYAFSTELRPGTASRVASLDYNWKDGLWMSRRAKRDHFKKPMNIYEVHLGSWKQNNVPRVGEKDVPAEAFYSYRQTADELIPYVKEMGYSHIELMPVMEHPFDGSWGYQVTGYYAATSRYGTPQDLMYLIESCHKAGIGVILDWVPGHFCRDAHGLGRFNGEKLYEDMDHAHWGTYTFDFGRKEVRSFLLSNAVFWMELFHADGLRVDGVSSMLYLNFAIDDPAQKRYNKYGEEGNLEAVSFLQEFNRVIGTMFPGTFTVAEESSSWPNITKPPEEGGLGFHYKWDMGWMNDTLKYMKTDFPWRPYEHGKLTFSMMYAFNENFVLPLSHDEVVHGKYSLIGRQPGDYWRQFAGLRLLALYQMTHSGGKLNFMGNEFGQFIEWRYYEGLEWFLLDYEQHRKHLEFTKALNHLYLDQPSFWQRDFSWEGYRWIDADNNGDCILSYIRQGDKPSDQTVVIINFRTDSHFGFRLGVPKAGAYREIFNSDEEWFGGSGRHFNPLPVQAEQIPANGMDWSVEVTVPPLGGIVLKRENSRITGTKKAETASKAADAKKSKKSKNG